MSEKKFASQADLEEKKISFDKLSDHAYAYTAEGDPNTGIIVGDDAVMVIDTQATPVMAQDVIRRIREVTDKPIRYVVLSHYHAVRVLGASGYQPEHIIASRDTYDLIVERGEQDMKSEIERFPRLFRAVESVPGLTWPTIVFEKRMTLWLGKLQVELMQLGRGHTKGDTVVWLPQERILFSGDLVEYDATPYTGDAYLTDWPATLDAIAALQPEKLVPGRGAALQTPAAVKAGLDGTRAFVTAMFDSGEARRGGRQGPAHRVQGDLRGAEAAVRPLGHLRPLPAVRRDARVRRGHALSAIRASGPRSATRRCGRRWKAERLLDEDVHRTRSTSIAARPSSDGDGAPSSGRRRRRRPGGPGRRHRSRAARHSGARARRRRHGQRGLARDLLFEAHAGDPRPPGLRRTHRAQGRELERRQGLPRERPRLPVRPPARARTSPPGVRQPAAVLLRGVPGRTRAHALAGAEFRWRNKVVGVAPARDARHAARRHARRRLRADLRLADRLRRRAQSRCARCWGSTPRGRCFATAS